MQNLNNINKWLQLKSDQQSVRHRRGCKPNEWNERQNLNQQKVRTLMCLLEMRQQETIVEEILEQVKWFHV